MSEIAVSPELTKAIQEALNPADIRATVQAEIEKQGAAAATAAAVAAADKEVADAKAAAEAVGATTGGFIRTENIGGQEFTFEADSELELERAVNNAFKVAYAVKDTYDASVTSSVVDPAVAAAAAKKAAEDAAVFKADLELKFKRGEITTSDYLEQSGALKEYLEKQGVPLDALRESVNRTQDSAEAQSWEDATKEFLNGPAGKDWPGGDNNLEIIGLKLQSLNLVDAKDKVAALAQAYAAMKATGTIFPYQEPVVAVPVVAAAAAVPVVAAIPAAVVPAPAAPARVAATSSSVFGASSGISGAGGITPAAAAAKTEIPADASPTEIIAAWKAAQVAAGKDPNAAFYETFNRGTVTRGV